MYHIAVLKNVSISLGLFTKLAKHRALSAQITVTCYNNLVRWSSTI